MNNHVATQTPNDFVSPGPWVEKVEVRVGVDTNDDGSTDIFFGPEKPEGTVNWVQTIPNKGWNVLWRIYSPTQVWYDKAWRQGEIERVK